MLDHESNAKKEPKMCYSGLGFLLQQRVNKVILPCSWQGLSLVLSTAFTICPESMNSKKSSLAHEAGVWSVYIHVQGAVQGDLWPNEEWVKVFSVHTTVSQTLLVFLSYLTLRILEKCLHLIWLKPLSLQFYFHDIAKILQQSRDTLEKCHFKENNMVIFYFLLLPQSNSVLWERDRFFFFFLALLHSGEDYTR